MIILASSKGQDFSPVPWPLPPTRPVLLAQAQHLIMLLRQYDQASLGTLMGISRPLAERTHAQLHAFTGEGNKPALLAYSGEAFRSLDAASFSPDDLHYAQQRLRILSGLYGILRPLDLIEPHRLEMGAPLANAEGTHLYVYWQRRISDQLATALTQEPSPLLINLASHEYAKAVDKKRLPVPWIDIQFKEEEAGRLKSVAIHAKRARGLMAAYLLRHRIERPEEITLFTGGGYAFRPELSTNRQLVFTRPAT